MTLTEVVRALVRAELVVVRAPKPDHSTIPEVLRPLDAISDGLFDPRAVFDLVWPADRVETTPGGWCFGDDGTGDPWVIDDCGCVFHSNRRDDHRRFVAPSLADFLQGWFDGSVTV